MRVMNADLTSAKQALSNENATLTSQLTELEGRAATLGKNKKSLEQQLDEVKNALEEESRVCMGTNRG
jgi:chaperonin cofactor prefoldin